MRVNARTKSATEQERKGGRIVKDVISCNIVQCELFLSYTCTCDGFGIRKLISDYLLDQKWNDSMLAERELEFHLPAFPGLLRHNYSY